MALQKQQKAKILKAFKRSELDTGSSEVQVALLTQRINELTVHFQKNKNDQHGRTGLSKLVNRRRKLLDYLKRDDVDKYRKLIGDLSIRK